MKVEVKDYAINLLIFIIAELFNAFLINLTKLII